MFCPNCGTNLPDDAKFCGSCGTRIGNSVEDTIKKESENIKKGLDGLDKNVDDFIKGTESEFHGHNRAYENVGTTFGLQEDRSIVLYIIFTLLTCGIYHYYVVYKLANDINIIGQGEEDSTPGLATYFFLSLLTCGFYSIYWMYKLGNRIQVNGNKLGLVIEENGTTILLWYLIGLIVCGVGPYVAMYFILKNMNFLSSAYNRRGGV